MPSSSTRSSSSRRGGRDEGSRRTRSSRRSRSRHRERRNHSRSQSRFRFKHKERNFPAAICNMITIVVLCVAMAEPKWIYLAGGGCSVLNQNGKVVDLHYLGVTEFFYSGMLRYQGSDLWYQYGPSDKQVLVNCVDSAAVQQFKTVIALCFTTVIVSLIAFLLDLTGPSGKILQTLHRYAIFSIITVVVCVVMNVLCYLISTQIASLQTQTKLHKGSKINVTFDISFYLISGAGSMAVFAVACNCFRRYPMYEEHPYQRMEDCDDLESIIPPSEQDMSPMNNLPPPPAYTPSPNMPSSSSVTPSASELPSYSESMASAQLSATPMPQPSNSSAQLSVNA